MKKYTAVYIYLMFFVVLGVQVLGHYAHNQTECSFESQCTSTDTNTAASNSYVRLESYIVQAGGYVLKSQSYWLLFLSKLETSEMAGLAEALNNSLLNVENAFANYDALLSLSNQLIYDENIQDKLKALDYEGFCQRKSLNPINMNTVSHYLSRGDVRGVYSHSFLLLDEIWWDMYAIKADLSSGVMPDPAVVRKLNNKIINLHLFGQYVSEIFANLLRG